MNRLGLSLAVTVAGLAGPAVAGIINVPANHPTIQAAIAAAVDGDEIIVAPGTYPEAIDFLGKAITVRSSGGPAVTTINATAPNSAVTCSSFEGPDTTLEGFTITGGNGAPFGGGMFIEFSSPTVIDCVFTANMASSGGAIYNNASRPLFVGCTFNDNTAVRGGAIYSTASGPVFADCTFSSNQTSPKNSDGNGGAIYHTAFSNVVLTNCSFSANSAGVSSGTGGAIYQESSSNALLMTCTFSGNIAVTSGGAIYQQSGVSVLTGCVFTGNSATFGSGGGVYSSSSDTTLTGCTFVDNVADFNGAGLYNGSGSALISECMFTGNVSRFGSGGGLYNGGGSALITKCMFTGNAAKFGSGMYNNLSLPNVTNCTFIGNSSGVSGGIYNISSSPRITNCIFSGNIAASFGGCIFNNNSSDPIITNCTFSQNHAFIGAVIHNFDVNSNPIVINCIVWGNSNVVGSSIDGDGNASVTWSNIEGGFAGTGNIDADPLFVDADGVDDTPGTADDNLRLLSGSPSIETGDNTFLPPDQTDLDGDGNFGEIIPFDLDGNDRVLDADGDKFAVVDMGAYEFVVPLAACQSDVNGDGVTNVLDLIDLLLCFGQPAVRPCDTGQDVNGDGTVDVLDLIDLLLAFGAECPLRRWARRRGVRSSRAVTLGVRLSTQLYLVNDRLN